MTPTPARSHRAAGRPLKSPLAVAGGSAGPVRQGVAEAPDHALPGAALSDREATLAVAAALRQRAALIPPRYWQEHYGGRGLPWAMAYLRRLDQTQRDRDAASSAVVSLRSEGQQAIARQASAPARLPGPRREQRR